VIGSPSNYNNAYFEVQSVREFGTPSDIEVREFGASSAIEILPGDSPDASDDDPDPDDDPPDIDPPDMDPPDVDPPDVDPPDEVPPSGASSASREKWFMSVYVLFGVALAALVFLVAL
jgi:hypothetical protein